MQVIYLSNRPDVLLDTLKSVATWMPFVDSALACMPAKAIAGIQSQKLPLNCEFIDESELFSKSEYSELLKTDHQTRNYALRQRLVARGEVEPLFLMSDDDARPLRPIEKSQFIQDNKYRNYYFYDLAHWNNARTEFDHGQHCTFAVLNFNALPTLSYASHQPQIIDKELFLLASERFAEDALEMPLCEWSTYFNLARKVAPEKFQDPEPYITMCWPEHPLAWPQYIVPSEYAFENFTPALYDAGLPFRKHKTDTHEHLALKRRIRVWREYTILTKHPEQRRGLLKLFNPRGWANKLIKR